MAAVRTPWHPLRRQAAAGAPRSPRCARIQAAQMTGSLRPSYTSPGGQRDPTHGQFVKALLLPPSLTRHQRKAHHSHRAATMARP